MSHRTRYWLYLLSIFVLSLGVSRFAGAHHEPTPQPRALESGSTAPGQTDGLFEALSIKRPAERIMAPDVPLTDTEGKARSLKEFRGRLVLVNFWATWCVPCQWEMPLMDKLYQAYKAKGFVVVAISLDQEGAAVVEPFVKEKKLTYPVLLDPSLKGAMQFGVRGVPATFLIGADGLIKGITYGPKEWDGPDARAMVESLLPKGRGSKG